MNHLQRGINQKRVGDTGDLLICIVEHTYTTCFGEQYKSAAAPKHINKKQKKAWARQRTVSQSFPRIAPSYDLVLEKAAMGHFRATASDECVYRLSMDGPNRPVLCDLDSKRSVVGPGKSLQADVCNVCVYVCMYVCM